MKAHEQPQRAKPESAGARDGVRWRQTIGVWFAVKQSEDGKSMYKSFRPDDDSEEAHQIAKERAKAWIVSDETGDADDHEAHRLRRAHLEEIAGDRLAELADQLGVLHLLHGDVLLDGLLSSLLVPSLPLLPGFRGLVGK